MSQPHVERVIGRLMTDEGLRRRFGRSAVETLRQLVAQGFELNDCEWKALAAIDPRRIERFARSLEPCIQKVDLEGGTP